MKNKLMLPLLGALALAASPLRAQNEMPISKPQATAPYRTAIGFRTNASGPAGAKFELRMKHFVKPESAFELQVGQWHYHESYQASLHYIWQPQLLTSSRLKPYAGIGIGAVGTTRNRYLEKQDMEVGAVLLASAGLEYTFPKIPLALSIDYRHTLIGHNTHTLRSLPLTRMHSFGIGIKYIFR
ncbi:hypothetical protein DXT99_17225 [Pontibacter diazotrophicus]|uniref:Outer membrane protein beta-barrel domain-containing protein n=1 Tax=Pontibacter diazotrophicus TaxID=1400979 RepID=A0A3D8L8T3_9BACT|nr:hypothetical protein [Pontibacter diazotrophicus]RDV13778.1 hypothetical protein DXT99_17225 [Pontibacter diazotrophicus]